MNNKHTKYTYENCMIAVNSLQKLDFKQRWIVLKYGFYEQIISDFKENPIAAIMEVLFILAGICFFVYSIFLMIESIINQYISEKIIQKSSQTSSFENVQDPRFKTTKSQTTNTTNTKTISKNLKNYKTTKSYKNNSPKYNGITSLITSITIPLTSISMYWTWVESRKNKH